MHRVSIEWMVVKRVTALVRILAVITGLLLPVPSQAEHASPSANRSGLPGPVQPLTSKDLSLARLRAAVEANRPSSKAEFLKLLPPECRRQYLMVHHSSATACSSYAKPRLIISCSGSSETGLIMAVDGESPEIPASECQKVEILETDPETGEIRSAEIRFPGRPESPFNYLSQPSRCASCHGEPLRHLADRYPSWPGFFDSSRRGIKVNSPEWHGYQQFKEQRKNDPLYDQLTPYKEIPTTNSGEKAIAIHIEDDTSFTSRFFNSLSRTHQRRVGTWLVRHPRFEYFRYALYAALKNCPNLDSFFPESLRKTGTPFDEMNRQVRQGIDNADSRVLRQLGQFNWKLELKDDISIFRLSESEIRPVVGLSFVVERMGIDPRFLSTSPFRDEVTFPVDLVLDRPELSSGGLVCEEIREKSLAALATLPTSTAVKAGSIEPRIAFQKCVACHTPAMAKRLGAPAIPFDDVSKLSTLLKDGNDLGSRILDRVHTAGVLRMPPNQKLEAGEAEAVARFVEDYSRTK